MPLNIQSLVVTAQWLADHLNHPEIAIADCRFSLADAALGRQQYEAAHLPGAYYFDLSADLSAPVGQHGGRHPLPDITQFAQKLEKMGLNSDASEPKWVIAYDDSRFAFASRFWWLLRYLGYDRVALLDGGLSGWKDAGLPLTGDVPPAQEGHFVPHVRADWVVDRETVIARQEQPGVVLVDSREGDRYRGEREPIDPIAGHIPGAVNYPWLEVTTADGTLRSPQEQQQRWSNLSTAEEIIVYCGSGVTACVNLLSLERAGVRNAKLYPGSWSDWCSYL